MMRVAGSVVLGLIAAATVVGLFFNSLIPEAAAAPSLPAFMIEVNGVQVHRFIDTSGGFASVCYVADKPGLAASISCVRAKP